MPGTVHRPDGSMCSWLQRDISYVIPMYVTLGDRCQRGELYSFTGYRVVSSLLRYATPRT